LFVKLRFIYNSLLDHNLLVDNETQVGLCKNTENLAWLTIGPFNCRIVKLGVLNIIFVNDYSSLTFINQIFQYGRITGYPVIRSQSSTQAHLIDY